MKKTLVSWIGDNDLMAPESGREDNIGAVARTLGARSFARAVLLYGYGAKRQAQLDSYMRWLSERTQVPIELRPIQLEKPTDLSEIYAHVSAVLDEINGEGEVELAYHISSGSKAMAALWIFIGKALYVGEILESHPESGVTTVEMPFDFKMEFARKLERSTAGLVPKGSNFESIIYLCEAMKEAVNKARTVADIPVTVLLEGDSGTGKELFANAIHNSSKRAAEPFVAVNCGAIPKDLIESELFGHVKGAFSGANTSHKGFFEQAHGGTLFLDEVGELPLDAQVKLLRALNDHKIRPVGSERSREVDVRIVAATHRKLNHDVAEGRFREDLFYRLAVAVIKLPRLSERGDDIDVIAQCLMSAKDSKNPIGQLFKDKHLSEAARMALRQHTWPGNVRELSNTLTRAALWASGKEITADDIRGALMPAAPPGNSDLMDHPLSESFDLERDVLDRVKRHYIARALDATEHNKTRAAGLLGLNSQQTLTNWMKRCGL